MPIAGFLGVFHESKLWIKCGKVPEVFEFVENLEFRSFFHILMRRKNADNRGGCRLSPQFSRGVFTPLVDSPPLMRAYYVACENSIVLRVLGPYNVHRYRIKEKNNG